MASIEAIYGRLGVCLGSAVRSSTMSFLIGTAAIVAFSVGSRKYAVCERLSLNKIRVACWGIRCHCGVCVNDL